MAEESIGALWKKLGRNGAFLSGNITINGVKHNIVVFQNTYKKEGETTPDLKIYASKPRDENPRQQPAGFMDPPF